MCHPPCAAPPGLLPAAPRHTPGKTLGYTRFLTRVGEARQRDILMETGSPRRAWRPELKPCTSYSVTRCKAFSHEILISRSSFKVTLPQREIIHVKNLEQEVYISSSVSEVLSPTNLATKHLFLNTIMLFSNFLSFPFPFICS